MLHTEQTLVLEIWRAASGLWELQETEADVTGEIQEKWGCKLVMSAKGINFMGCLLTQPWLDPKLLLRIQVGSSPCAVQEQSAVPGARARLGPCMCPTLMVN